MNNQQIPMDVPWIYDQQLSQLAYIIDVMDFQKSIINWTVSPETAYTLIPLSLAIKLLKMRSLNGFS